MSDTDECRARAEWLAREAGMQFDPRYSHWVAARGKFEGQEWYAPYYYDAAMNSEGWAMFGSAEENPPCGEVFKVTSEESDAFGLNCGAYVLVSEDSQGFVHVTVHGSQRDAEKTFYAWIGEPIAD